MNVCDSCKKFDACGVRIDGVDRHSCIWGDPITCADLAARDTEIRKLYIGIRTSINRIQGDDTELMLVNLEDELRRLLPVTEGVQP